MSLAAPRSSGDSRRLVAQIAIVPLLSGALLGPDWDQTYGGGASALGNLAAVACTKRPVCSGFRKWRGPESNWRHHDFQSCALPTELPRPQRLMVAGACSAGSSSFAADLSCPHRGAGHT